MWNLNKKIWYKDGELPGEIIGITWRSFAEALYTSYSYEVELFLEVSVICFKLARSFLCGFSFGFEVFSELWNSSYYPYHDLIC